MTGLKTLTAVAVAASTALLLAGCSGEPAPRHVTTIVASIPPVPTAKPTPATPTPEHTAAVPAPTVAPPHVISEQARHVLDVNLGAGFDASPAIKEQYCTMSDTMLENVARITVDTYRDIVEADVIAYVNEACGR